MLRELSREVDAIRLDYNGLYEKVRTNLAKLAKRADGENPCTENAEADMDKLRRLLVERKLRRGA